MYFGTRLTNELEKAGHRPSKAERKSMSARQRVLDKVFGPEKSEKRFRDPMSMI